MPRVTRSLVLAASLALAMLALVGCGSDDPSKEEDEKAIREVVSLSLTTEDHAADCNERLSEGFIRRTYRSRARCVRVQTEDDEDPADSVSFSRVEVDGDKATAEIRIRGGDTDDAAGGLDLIREDDDWRIDQVSAPLLRSLVEAGLDSQDGGQLPRGAGDCLKQGLRGLSDAELRRTAYALIGETEAGERRTFELLAGCRGRGGRSALQQIFEQGIAGSLRQRGSNDAQIRCVLNRLRADVSGDELAAALAGAGARQRTARLIAPAITACR